MSEALQVHIGWDPRESRAYSIAHFSMMRRTSKPLDVWPLMYKSLVHDKIMDRDWIIKPDGTLFDTVSDAPMATEFAITRFAIPKLQKEGWALFCDCDMLFVDDIAKVFDLADDKYAVMVCKHDYEPREEKKMDGQIQTQYARKNWSSFILWNCSHPSNKNLTREALNTWPGKALHQFRWLDDSEIGELPLEWNWLAGVYDTRPAQELSNIHFTLGGPWFSQWPGGPYDDLFLKEEQIYKHWLQRGGRR